MVTMATTARRRDAGRQCPTRREAKGRVAGGGVGLGVGELSQRAVRQTTECGPVATELNGCNFQIPTVEVRGRGQEVEEDIIFAKRQVQYVWCVLATQNHLEISR